MQRYLIERDLPSIGIASAEDLKAAAIRSNQALAQLAPDIQWIESYVTRDKTFCIYLATDEAMVHKHAELSGFPVTTISEVSKVIDPTTAGCAVEP